MEREERKGHWLEHMSVRMCLLWSPTVGCSKIKSADTAIWPVAIRLHPTINSDYYYCYYIMSHEPDPLKALSCSSVIWKPFCWWVALDNTLRGLRCVWASSKTKSYNQTMSRGPQRINQPIYILSVYIGTIDHTVAVFNIVQTFSGEQTQGHDCRRGSTVIIYYSSETITIYTHVGMVDWWCY